MNLTNISSRKINVLQVMPEFGLAGAEIMCESLCYELQKSGKYNVYIVSLFEFHSPITKRMEAKGFKIFYIGKSRGLDLKIIIKLARLMAVLNIDAVHTHRYVMQYAIPAAIIARVRVRIHTVHNIAEKEVDFFRQKIASFFYQYCNVTPVSISPLIQHSVMKRYALNAKQTPVVYNGINLDSCIIHHYDVHAPFRFIHIGRFSKQKNHGTIIEAANRLKASGYSFTINLIGGLGNEEERKREVMDKKLGDVIIFNGCQSNVYPFLNESDCFILPSFYEGMPITLVEAMGCGMPIIASAVGGIPDMIKNGESGILIEPTVDDLVDAMISVMTNNVLREKIGRNALTTSKHFSSEQMFEGYNKLYKYNDKNSEKI